MSTTLNNNIPQSGDAPPSPKPVELAVFDFIREYVEIKTEVRSGIAKGKASQPGTYWNPPKDYREACEKICSGAFYRLRACKNQQDFMAYFSSALCSVPHNLSRQNYQLIAGYLLRDDDVWQEIKSLCMLALSKFSYFRNEESSTPDEVGSKN